MIQSVYIRGIRGIREGQVDDLSPLTILVGPNGTGKSTILDAILIGASPVLEDGIGTAVKRRSGVGGARWLFWRAGADTVPSKIVVGTNYRSGRDCRLLLADATRGRIKIRCKVTPCVDGASQPEYESNVFFEDDNSYEFERTSEPLPDLRELRIVDTAGLAPLHSLYSKAVEQGRRESIQELVSHLIPNAELEILTNGDVPVVHLVFEDHSVPVLMAGDGIHTLLRLALELAPGQRGVVLLEEPEVHKHAGAIFQSARAIWEAVGRGIQVILTTHSLELIDALLSLSQSDRDLDLMSLFRVGLNDGVLTTKRIPGREIAYARTTVESDLR